MKNKMIQTSLLLVTGILFPLASQAQAIAGSIGGMQSVLDQVYNEMIPLCSKLIDVGRGIAGFGATCYIAVRVWRHIAHAEAIDFFPLLRPFALGIAILLFPSVIGVMNGVLQPTVTATGDMVKDSDKAIARLLEEKEKAVKQTKQYQMYGANDGAGNREEWYKYTHPDEDPADEGMIESVGNSVQFAMAKMSYSFRNWIKQFMSEVLQVLYQAAALCINTIRTFFLIVLAILGPIVLGIAVFDGFQQSLTQWIARYINVFLWLPIANIFGSIIGKVQENMLKLDLSQIQDNGDTFFSATDTAYLVFLVIAIAGYFTVPSVANYIVHAHGGNGLLHKINNMSSTSVNAAGAATGSAGSQVGGRLYDGARNMANTPGYIMEGYNNAGSDKSNYQQDKISGNA